MVAVGAALVPAAGAQAATPGLFSVCDNGRNFEVQAEFPPGGAAGSRRTPGHRKAVGRQALCFSSAAPNDTLKRSHQIVTVENFFRSVPAGIA